MGFPKWTIEPIQTSRYSSISIQALRTPVVLTRRPSAEPHDQQPSAAVDGVVGHGLQLHADEGAVGGANAEPYFGPGVRRRFGFGGPEAWRLASFTSEVHTKPPRVGCFRPNGQGKR